MCQSGKAAGAGDRTSIVAGGVRCQAAGVMCYARVLLSIVTGRHDVGNTGSVST